MGLARSLATIAKCHAGIGTITIAGGEAEHNLEVFMESFVLLIVVRPYSSGRRELYHASRKQRFGQRRKVM